MSPNTHTVDLAQLSYLLEDYKQTGNISSFELINSITGKISIPNVVDMRLNIKTSEAKRLIFHFVFCVDANSTKHIAVATPKFGGFDIDISGLDVVDGIGEVKNNLYKILK